MSLAFDGTKRYRVVRPLGVGGMGEVYEVEDRASGARLALKRMLTADPRRLLRFKQEFRLMAELHHPNLVRLYDLATEDGDWFFTMELVEGQDLMRVLTDPDGRGDDDGARRVKGTGATADGMADTADSDPTAGHRRPVAVAPIVPTVPATRQPAPACDPEPLLAVLAQILDALDFLHRQGVVHRDLKPSNILVDVDGRVRVLDFGLVSRIDRVDAISMDGAIVGTLAYLSPEQLHGEPATAASDLYALGCVLFQLLTGHLPFREGIAGAIAGRLGEPPRVEQHVDGVAPALADMVCRLMAIDPGERPTLDDVRAALGLTAGVSASRTDRIATASSDRFVGRAAELAALTACLETARDRRAQLALVSGASGIGKSALADELIRRATVLGFVCFRGRSYEREQVPYVAFDRVIDAITVALQRWPRERIAPLRPALRALARIFPALALVSDTASTAGLELPDDDALDPREQRRRAFDGLARVLAHWQAEGPLLLVLDDLQWADDESLALLEALFTGGTGRLAILALARRDGARDHPLAAMVARLGAAAAEQVVTIELSAMPADEAIEIVDSVGGGRLDADTARALAEHAGGNPFLVRRLAEHLAGLGPAERAAVLDASGSSDDVLREMIGALSPRAEQVLALAAAAGGDAPASLLRDVSGMTAEEFDLAAGELMAARFLKKVAAAPAFSGRARGAVDASARVDLYHDRIREVVYRGLDDDRRRTLHRGLALTLQATASDDGHDAEALARHWGAAGDRAQRRRYALEAAELAGEKLAFRRAAELLRVVQGDPDADEAVTVTAARWERIGELNEFGGDLTSAGEAFRRALALWDELASAPQPADTIASRVNPEIPRACLRLSARAGVCALATGDLALGRELFGRGLASLGLPLDRSMAGRIATLLALSIRERLTGPGKPRAAPDPWVATRVRFFDLMMRGFQPFWPLAATEAVLRCALLGRKAAEHDARLNALAFSAAGPVAQRRCSPGTLARSGRLLDAAEQIARAHAVPLGVEIVQINRAMLWLATDPARARKVSDAALAGLAGQGMGESYEGNRARGQHMLILFFLGHDDELVVAADREIAIRDNNMVTVVLAHLCRARIFAIRGDVEAARRGIEAIRARLPVTPVSSMLSLLRIGLAGVQVAEGRFADALAGADAGEREMRETGSWLVGMNRSTWIEPMLDAAIGLARRRQLAPRDRARVLGWARWLAKHGLFDYRCVGDRALALLEHAAGHQAAADKAIASALTRSAAGASPYHRWVCLEAARELGRLNLDLEAEAADLAVRGRFALPPGWRSLDLPAGTP